MNSFKKVEKLCSQKRLDELVRKGTRVNQRPIIGYIKKGDLESEQVVSVAFSVPKRFHKKAVTRNKIKRQMREAYRLHKQSLLDQCVAKGTKCDLLFVYNSTVHIDFQDVQTKIILTLERFIKELAN